MIKIKKTDESGIATTWKDLSEALAAGEAPLGIGDEIDIELKNGEAVTLVCELVEDGHARLYSKDLLEDTRPMNENWITGYRSELSGMTSFLNQRLRRMLPDDLQEVIVGDIVLLKEKEVFGENIYGEEETCPQLPRYKERENRVKRLSGKPFPYWLASPKASNSTNFCSVYSDGSAISNIASNSSGVCFGLKI